MDSYPHMDLTKQVIGAAIDVHKALGPGLLESVYEVCLQDELEQRGISCERQIELPIAYKGRLLNDGYRIDLLVQQCVIVEIKSVERVLPVFEAQLLTYLRLSRKTVGLLINFNVPRLRDGITRRVLTTNSSMSSSASSAPLR